MAMLDVTLHLGLTAFVGLIGSFFVKLYRVRSHVRSLQKQGLPMLPHSFLFGHLQIVANIMAELPPHVHGVYIADRIRQKFPEMDAAFYLDVWPVGHLYLMVIKPDLFHQLTQANQLPKDPGLQTFLKPLAGKQNLATMEGSVWKRWRSIFNPGFSASHISSLVPSMVDKVAIFDGKIDECVASGEMFLLEEMALDLTIDIIGGAVMDHDFQSQSKYNDMTSALRSQLKWSTTGVEMNPLHTFNFLRPFVNMYNTWRMDRYLNPQLNERYGSVLNKHNNPGKSVIDLALKAYLAENPSAESIPDAFKHAAIAQIKLFIFAGHDTTSSATVFTYDLLSRHPKVLAKLLNQLPYTLGVIKEALRVYPTVAAPRVGQPNFSLVSESGQRFPTNGCIILGDHYGTHHNPSVWPEPEKFFPERWLVEEDDPLYPPKNAWRPCERGPRNCVGMELAMTEIKIILTMTLRKYNLDAAYEEFDRLKKNPSGMNVNGSRIYMVRGTGGGHPADGYPCKATLAIRKSVE